MGSEQASQTRTFLFTDIEGSTRLWEDHRQAMQGALERHDAILREAVEGSNGQVVNKTGDGLMAVFASSVDAVSASVDAQRRLADEPWGETGPLRVRMAVHAGEATPREGDYFGPTLNRAARLMSAGHGGQVLLSASAASLVMDELPDGCTMRDLGEHNLKDLGRAERVFQLVHPSLGRDFPPLVTRSRRRIELPEQPSTFVGRDEELAQIKEWLRDESVRLLTLTGPGGIGKTRMALQAAADEADRFEHGVFFVDLSSVSESESVLAAIAHTLGLGETGDGSLLDELSEQLRDQQALLLLDNFEQATAAAPAVAQLLQGCRRLKLLVTSREALRVGGEQQFEVPSLSLPSAGRGPVSADELEQYEAVQLFVERAKAVRPDFRITDENASAVAEICLRLDGLPLAIELATARITLFSPEALRDRLDKKLEILEGGPRDAPARQRTLRATIEWSYQLLEPAEQRLFELLSAFSGASYEAVEAVAKGVGGQDGTEIDPLSEMASLIGKSLVRRSEPIAGEPRLVMLETIREYAADRLADLPAFSAAARRAHAIHYADLARREWESLTGDRRDETLARLAAEVGNLRSAWHHWVGERDLDQLDKLLDSLWLLYESRGWYRDTIELTSELLDILSSAPSTPERAAREVTLRTSLARALLAIHGYTEEVEEAYTRALELFEGEEVPQLFPVLRGLASFHTYRSEFEKGAQVGRQILSLAEAQDDPDMRVDGHLVVGSNLLFQSDLHGGLEHFDQAVSLFRPSAQGSRRYHLGSNPGVTSLTASALALWLVGFPDRALERANRAVSLATEMEQTFTLAYALFHSGFLHLWRREFEPMRARAVGLIDVADEHDLEIWSALGRCLLGAARTALGRSEQGLVEMEEGIAMYKGLRTPPVFWPLLLFVRAEAQGRAGRPADGLGLIEEAIEIAEQGSGRTLAPEFLRLKGELLNALSGPDGRSAGGSFLSAYEIAAEVEARMPQLRAAIGLCRYDRERGDAERATRLLRDTYATFTEGFMTPDLIDAADLLDGESPEARRSPTKNRD